MSSSANPQPPAPTRTSVPRPPQGYELEELAQPPEITDSPEMIDPAGQNLKAGAQDRAKQRLLLQKIPAASSRSKRPPTASSSSIPSRWKNASPSSSTASSTSSRSSASPTTAWSAASTRAGSRTSTPASRPPSSTSAKAKTPFSTTGTCSQAAADSSIEIVRVNKKKNAPPRPKVDPTVAPHPRPLPARHRHRHPGDQGSDRLERAPHHHQSRPAPAATVLMTPHSDQCGISRKIEDPRERQRLKRSSSSTSSPSPKA